MGQEKKTKMGIYIHVFFLETSLSLFMDSCSAKRVCANVFMSICSVTIHKQMLQTFGQMNVSSFAQYS